MKTLRQYIAQIEAATTPRQKSYRIAAYNRACASVGVNPAALLAKFTSAQHGHLEAAECDKIARTLELTPIRPLGACRTKELNRIAKK